MNTKSVCVVLKVTNVEIKLALNAIYQQKDYCPVLTITRLTLVLPVQHESHFSEPHHRSRIQEASRPALPAENKITMYMSTIYMHNLHVFLIINVINCIAFCL